MKRTAKIGERFGKLVVISLNNKDPRGSSWLCKCDCGNELVLGDYQLIGTKSRRPHKSCGCSKYRYKGAVSNHWRLYDIWKNMKRRCYDDKSSSYKRYGAVGVKVSDDWKDDFEPFLNWSLSNGYSDDLTLDRIDSKKDYSPMNCRWVDYNTQMQTRGIMGNNTTGVNGVSYMKKQKKYKTYIQRNHVKKNLGLFETLEEAEKARLQADQHFKKYGTIENLK